MNQEMGWEAGLDWSGSGLGHTVDALECSNAPSGSLNAGNFVTTWGPFRFWKDSAP
jgi:hypothetical protein